MNNAGQRWQGALSLGPLAPTWARGAALITQGAQRGEVLLTVTASILDVVPDVGHGEHRDGGGCPSHLADWLWVAVYWEHGLHQTDTSMCHCRDVLYESKGALESVAP